MLHIIVMHVTTFVVKKNYIFFIIMIHCSDCHDLSAPYVLFLGMYNIAALENIHNGWIIPFCLSLSPSFPISKENQVTDEGQQSN